LCARFTYRRSSTRRGHTPASITAWILSLVPSDKYERAQHASVRTSSSLEWISRASAGRAGLVYTTKKTTGLVTVAGRKKTNKITALSRNLIK